MNTEQIIQAINDGCSVICQKYIEMCPATDKVGIMDYFNSIIDSVSQEIATLTTNLLHQNMGQGIDWPAIIEAMRIAKGATIYNLAGGCMAKIVN